MSVKLHHTQLFTLRIIVKFRYVTSDNLALYRSISQNAAYRSLESLLTTGLIGKLHDKSYRLQNKAARYYLTPAGTTFVRKEIFPDLPSSLWARRQKDKTKSPEFIDEQVALFAACNQLLGSLGVGTSIFTATELYDIEDVIRPLPGLFVQPAAGNHFFVEVTDGQPLFMVRKRIKKYIQNHEDHDWDWKIYPDIYFIRSKASDRTRLRRFVTEQMDNRFLKQSDLAIRVVGAAHDIPRLI